MWLLMDVDDDRLEKRPVKASKNRLEDLEFDWPDCGLWDDVGDPDGDFRLDRMTV